MDDLEVTVMLRIAVVNWRDITHPKAGGAEVHLHKMMRHWVSNGYSVTQICPFYKNAKKFETVDGVEIIRVGNSYTVYPKAVIEFLKRRNNFDVVFESINTVPFFFPIYTNKAVIALYYQYASPFLLLQESPLLAIPAAMLQSLIPFVYRNSTIITISQSSKKQLVNLGLNPEKIFVIPPSIDQELFWNHDIKRKQFSERIIYLGRLVRYKGLLSMIKEFRKVVDLHPSAKFYIAGRGYLLPEILSLTHKLNLEKNVIVKGYVSEREKGFLLFDSSIAVYPVEVFDGGWSIAIAETMALGNVLVTTSSLQDMVNESKAGFVGPIDTFSRHICRILNDEVLWREMSLGAAEWARKFTLDRIASETLDKILKAYSSQ